MAKRSAAWRSGALLALSLALAAWAAAHGTKDWRAPEKAKKLNNPVPATEASLAAAKAIYLEKCAQCHGAEGKGDGPEAPMYAVKPADLTDARMMGEMTDGEIFWKISEGRRPMPTFKKQLTAEQRWQLVNYVRTLAPTPTPASPPKSPSAPTNKKSSPKP
jgi:mono/diheme cytochrome c family protein